MNKAVETYTIEANSSIELDCTSGKLPTGIKPAVTVPVAVKTIYDLSGRRVGKAEKGVYIINGQKVVR